MKHTASMERGLTTLVSGISSYTMAISTAISSTRILIDDTADFSSKLMALNSLLMFTAP